MTDVHVAETRARGKAAAAAEEAWGIEPIFGLFRKESGKRDGGVGRNFRRCPPESAVGSSLCYGRNNVTLRRELVELTAPAIYWNRKNANKGSLALCSLLSPFTRVT